MFEINMVCICIKDEPFMGLSAGVFHRGLIAIETTGETTFSIVCADGSVIKCTQVWFEDYFKIVKL